MRSTDTTPFKQYRRSRFYQRNLSWYFKTREGFNFGPFQTMEAAHETLLRFLKPKLLAQEFINFNNSNDTENVRVKPNVATPA